MGGLAVAGFLKGAKEFGEGLWYFLTQTTVGRVLGLSLIAIVAFFVYTASVEKRVTKEVETRVVTQVTREIQYKADAETTRRLKALEDAQAATRKDVERLVGLQLRGAIKLKEIEDASRKYDGAIGLPADSVARLDGLRELGQTGSEAQRRR